MIVHPLFLSMRALAQSINGYYDISRSLSGLGLARRFSMIFARFKAVKAEFGWAK